MTPLRILAATVAVALLAAGCAPWPAQRGGGQAELPWAEPTADQALGQALDQRVDACRAALEALRAAGGEGKAPAALATAQNLLVRSDREAAGGLYDDAAAGIDLAASGLQGVADLLGSTVSTACLA